jgi:hypothetical protein
MSGEYQNGDRRYYLGGKDLANSFYDNGSTKAGTNYDPDMKKNQNYES